MNRAARLPWLIIGGTLFLGLVIAGWMAPEFLSPPDLEKVAKDEFGQTVGGLGFFEAPPFGTNEYGIPLHELALQGASIVAIPSAIAGLMVMALATLAGLVRCADIGWLDTVLQAFGEITGALPRMVVVLVIALLLPYDYKYLLPIALVWALLASPAAMDEAAASAGRLGGARFVEALRAHGFSAGRIYLYHVVWLNLRPVIVRQGADVMMQVVFLEIALSYLALASNAPSFTHAESLNSWAELLYLGYSWILDRHLGHAVVLSLALIALTAFIAQSFRLAARAR
ncbi:MAG: hypothetical protein H6737_30725 [Alphaproteobacteria bacterium]|nr:hypothetical protein [Alphaproteobacteria bacterium]